MQINQAEAATSPANTDHAARSSKPDGTHREPHSQLEGSERFEWASVSSPADAALLEAASSGTGGASRHSALRRGANISHSALVYGTSTIMLVYGLLKLHPLTFDIGLLASGWLLTGLGITVGYHRLLAHRAFTPTDVAKWGLLMLGAMAGQGPPAYWAVLHRNHHKSSDKVGDPHSPISGFEQHPLRGFLHAHVGWIHDVGVPVGLRSTGDILRDPVVKAVGRLYPILMLLSLIIPTALGALYYGSMIGALRGFIWGGAARIVLVNNIIWSINSLCHLAGSRRYDTNDSSRNSWWLALPSLGEAWHNNHHVCPGSSAFSHRWWELDIGYSFIRALHFCGLVKAVHRISPRILAKP